MKTYFGPEPLTLWCDDEAKIWFTWSYGEPIQLWFGCN